MEEEVKNKYVIGTIGALIGAIIGSVPWILSYVFANMIYAILSVVIAVCAFYGYKLTKAKIDKKLPVILSVVSFIAITITMLVAIPLIYMAKEEVPLSFENFIVIYRIEEVSSVILTDYVISLIFCALVMGGIIYNLNKQIKHGIKDKDIKIITQSVENEMFSKEDIERARDVFERNDALSKKHTITKELIVEDLQREFGQEKGSKIFEYLKIEGVIKKKSNKYYFSEKAQNSPYYRYEFTNVKIFIIVVIIAAAIAALMYFTKTYPGRQDETTINDIAQGEVISSYTIENTNITLEFDEDMTKLSDEQITYYFGQGYSKVYESIITSSNFEKMIMVIQNNKSGFDEDYTARQFLEDIAAENEEELKVIEKEISDKVFYVLEREYESKDGTIYLEQDYVYDSGDNFVCIIFDNIKENAMNPEEIIK